MKNLLLSIVLTLVCVGVRAQQTAYCEMMQFSPGGAKCIISVDFGNDGTDELVDENNKKIKFKSSVDALMYFERLGWSVVSAYSVNHNSGLANVPVVHYLLKKKVEKIEDAMEGLHIKRNAPKKDTLF